MTNPTVTTERIKALQRTAFEHGYHKLAEMLGQLHTPRTSPRARKGQADV